MSGSARLSVNEVEIDLPLRRATLGQSAIEVTQLIKNNLITFDPGFVSTGSCASAITYVDEKGILLYRGYPIEQLAEHSNFLEVTYLLLFGQLPDAIQLEKLHDTLQTCGTLPQQIHDFLNSFSPDAHPMAKLLSATGFLATHYADLFNVHDAKQRNKVALHLIAQMPHLVALCYGSTSIKEEGDDYTETFMRNMLGVSQAHPTFVRALDRLLILHADHEQNASTSTVRMVASTGANLFACIASGISALWGPAHGGANEACLRMLKEIGTVERIDEFVKRAKDPEDPFRLMGFGHRVYKIYDPRAAIIRKTCYEVLEISRNGDQRLFQVAQALEKIALEDPYFIDRKLYPNVDFYSGIILDALKIPINFFTVIFALARTSGWVSHWLEFMDDPKRRIARPRQIYLGETTRDYIPIAQRQISKAES
jgi:citrate synthase